MQYGSCESCMSIRFNKAGTQLLALRRRLPPVLYNTHNSQAVAQFDHEGYYNSCTMKSCCFAGPDDEYVVSGSDDFVLYMWRVPHNETYGKSCFGEKLYFFKKILKPHMLMKKKKKNH